MKFTVLTSCYNCDKYIGKTIKSVKSQTYKNWEMIIVDDCSKDGSVKQIKKFSKKDSRIKLIRNKKRLKCGGSYNHALSYATGDICGVIDSDDILSKKNSMELIVDKYNKYPDIQYMWTQFWLCDMRLRKLRKGFCCHPGKESLLEAGVKMSKGRHAFSHWRTFRTKLREKGMIFKIGLPAAVDKWMGYALEEMGIGGFYGKPLYCYRQRVGGLSFTGRKHWKVMKKEFAIKREKNNIKPYPIKIIK